MQSRGQNNDNNNDDNNNTFDLYSAFLETQRCFQMKQQDKKDIVIIHEYKGTYQKRRGTTNHQRL